MGRCAVMVVLAVALLARPAFAVGAEFVVIVAVHSPVTVLASNEVADIYLGRLRRLPDGRTVLPVDRFESDGVQEAFYREILQRNAAQLRAHWSRLVFTGRGKPPRQVRSDAELVEFVARNPHAIGYVAPALVTPSVRVVRIDP
ncbi:MAG: hypothetical protein LC632_02380 [Xanthomonadaceae bacterium]|nr:hypothetical protein [Xanthomonadaceae bacterium]